MSRMTRDRRPGAVVGGTVLTPDRRLRDGVVTITEGRVGGVWEGDGGTLPTRGCLDARGALVLPGLVDLHGDDLEESLFPRADDHVPVERALHRSERAALDAGVTTKFHAVAFEEAPDDRRTVDTAETVAEAVIERDGALDGRLHARCELSSGAAVAAVREAAADGRADLVSTMRHVPGGGQFDDADAMAERYGEATDGGVRRVAEDRSEVTAATVCRRRAAVVDAANDAGLPVAVHDPVDPAAVDRAVAEGVDVCEFPVSLSAAERAAELGATVVMGAPNVVRGGSLWGNLDADRAIEAGAVDALASDFRPHSLLTAALADADEPPSERVRRVTAAPAEAAGLDDRGRLEAGARADLIVVDPEPFPTVRAVLVEGRLVYRAGDGGAGR